MLLTRLTPALTKVNGVLDIRLFMTWICWSNALSGTSPLLASPRSAASTPHSAGHEQQGGLRFSNMMLAEPLCFGIHTRKRPAGMQCVAVAKR